MACSIVGGPEKDHHKVFGAYPLIFAGASVSWCSLQVGAVWLCVTPRPRSSVGIAVVAYFAMAVLFNMAGLLGNMLHACHFRWTDGSDFVDEYLAVLWMSGTVLTNLALQKILTVRAASINGPHNFNRIGVIRRVLVVEVALACVLFGGSVCIFSVDRTLLIGSQRSPAAAVAILCIAAIAAMLFVLDIIFSWLVSWGMYQMARQGQRHLDPQERSDGLNRTELALAYLNFAFVCMSMITTTTFYAALGMNLIVGTKSPEQHRWWYTFVSITWF